MKTVAIHAKRMDEIGIEHGIGGLYFLQAMQMLQNSTFMGFAKEVVKAKVQSNKKLRDLEVENALLHQKLEHLIPKAAPAIFKSRGKPKAKKEQGETI